jgi:hypothetical protein
MMSALFYGATRQLKQLPVFFQSTRAGKQWAADQKYHHNIIWKPLAYYRLVLLNGSIAPTSGQKPQPLPVNFQNGITH